MKKLMENWRSFESETLKEQDTMMARAEKAFDPGQYDPPEPYSPEERLQYRSEELAALGIVDDMGSPSGISYIDFSGEPIDKEQWQDLYGLDDDSINSYIQRVDYEVETMERPPQPEGHPAFDLFLKGADKADHAYWKNVMEPYADEVHAVDAASKALHDQLGIPEAHASSILRYGIPNSEWLLSRTAEQLAEIGMTEDEAKQLAYFEWTDVVWDRHDPIDIAEVGLAATGLGLSAAAGVWAANRVRHLAKLPGFVADVLKTRRLMKAVPALADARKYERLYDAAGNLTSVTRKFDIPPGAGKFDTLADGSTVMTHVDEIKLIGLDRIIKPKQGGKLQSRPILDNPSETQISIPFMPAGFTEIKPNGKPVVKYMYLDKTDFNHMVDAQPELGVVFELGQAGDLEKFGSATAKLLGDFDAMTIPRAVGRAITDNPKKSAAAAAVLGTGLLAGEATLSGQDADLQRALSAAGGMPDKGPVPPTAFDLRYQGTVHGEPGAAATFFDQEDVDFEEDPAYKANPEKKKDPPGRRSDRYQESVERKKEIIREEIIKYFSNRR